MTFPQQYTPELAGKAAVFRVKAHRIVRRSMPELNDEFARAQGFSDAAALRQAIMSAALQRKEAQAGTPTPTPWCAKCWTAWRSGSRIPWWKAS